MGLELAAKDAAAPKKWASKKLLCRPAGSDNLQPQARRAAEVAPLLGPASLTSEGPQDNCHIHYCQPIIKNPDISPASFPP